MERLAQPIAALRAQRSKPIRTTLNWGVIPDEREARRSGTYPVPRRTPACPRIAVGPGAPLRSGRDDSLVPTLERSLTDSGDRAYGCGTTRNREEKSRSEEHTSELQSLMRISY